MSSTANEYSSERTAPKLATPTNPTLSFPERGPALLPSDVRFTNPAARSEVGQPLGRDLAASATPLWCGLPAARLRKGNHPIALRNFGAELRTSDETVAVSLRRDDLPSGDRFLLAP